MASASLCVLEHLDALEVRADGEDEGLAGDGDGDDRAGVGRLALDLVQRLGSSLASQRGPKVVGLVWSKPLSRVISAQPSGADRQVQVADVAPW